MTTLPPRAIIGLLGGVPEPYSNGAPPGTRLVAYTLDAVDPLTRLRRRQELLDARRAGDTILLASWDEQLLRDTCDEIWIVSDSAVTQRGDPAEMLDHWRAHIALRWIEEQTGKDAPLTPLERIGDGRATVDSVALQNAHGQPVLVWSSGEPALVRVTVLFHAPVENPVIGMLIRTRIGLNVYGTNTELEQLQLGPRAAGERIHIEFRFRCELCPGDYTVTIASHDPDGAKHEWLEDAVAFSVTDTRYTAGIANLRAEVSWAVDASTT